MAQYVEAPIKKVYRGNRRLFLAGGITNCRNWQQDAWCHLKDIADLTIYNPRREGWDTLVKDETYQQILWEANYLQKCKQILFWFSHETVQPITLFELGRWSRSSKSIFVGADPNYVRLDDIKIQLLLSNPMVVIHDNLWDTCMEVRGFYEQGSGTSS